MLKKVLCVSVIVLFCFSCLPVFSFAAQPDYYAAIPRPVPSDHVKYVVAQTAEGDGPYLFVVSIPTIIPSENFKFQFSTASGGEFYLHLYNYNPLGFSLYYYKYDLNGNFISTNIIPITAKDSTFSVNLIFWFDVHYQLIDPFDIPVADGYGVLTTDLANIAWSDATDPQVYTTWLNSINAKLNEIDNNTDNVEAQLSDISSQLSLFYSVFNSYQSQIIGNMSTIITSLNSLNSRLNTFAQQNHYDLQQIYTMLSQIYALLSEEPETRPPAIGNQDEVNDVLHSEAALNKDFSGDLQNQFNVAGNIFDGNSSFGFISNLFSDLLLSNASINGLIIFSLAIGLCVLILGRRLNA